jgi:hypothetical protein
VSSETKLVAEGLTIQRAVDVGFGELRISQNLTATTCLTGWPHMYILDLQ